LDKACQVEIKGTRGNDTEISIRFQPLEDVSRQTNFMNCGGDINIPHGELFTTPQLEGTNGLLHFKSVFLKGYHYKDLRLQFTDGFVEGYSCQNFETLSENREYILNTLFNNTYPMPIGEFSIGTNTAAYAVISKHGILDKLPILLVEKLGPHFAVGDPCYARGEDEKVFNIENGKEIMPKENSQTAKRHSDPDAGYTNVHTDITIPYEDIGFLTAVNHAGNRVDIIKDGLFVLPGLDLLNQPLLEIRG
jgi:aminopeptidase